MHIYLSMYLLELLEVGVAGDLGQGDEHEGRLLKHLFVEVCTCAGVCVGIEIHMCVYT